jgi:hypothetical protein
MAHSSHHTTGIKKVEVVQISSILEVCTQPYGTAHCDSYILRILNQDMTEKSVWAAEIPVPVELIEYVDEGVRESENAARL